MTETDEQERWRLETLLDAARNELTDHYLILNALDEYLTNPTPQALDHLRNTYATIMRNRYPDGRP